MNELADAVNKQAGWTLLKVGNDQNGPYVAATWDASGQAHQFRSLADWAVNGSLMERGGGGNLGEWAKRSSQELP